MPLYEYRCEACGRMLEVLQKLGEAPLTECPHCGGVLRKQFSAPAFHLKGSGWYATDYAKSGESEKKQKSDEAPAAATEATKKESAPAPAAGGDKPPAKSE